MNSSEITAEFYVEFGSRVKNARNRAAITQAELASYLNLTRSSIANLESGRQRIQIHLLPLLVQALNVAVDDLLPDLRKHLGSGPDKEALNDLNLGGISEASRKFLADALRVAPTAKVNDGTA